MIFVGRHDLAVEIARKSLEMFVRVYKSKGYVGENYNAITGEAAESGKASDKFYHWGALLVYTAIQNLIDFQVWNSKIKITPESKDMIRIPTM